MLHRKFIKVMKNKMLNASQKVYKSNEKQNVKFFTESL